MKWAITSLKLLTSIYLLCAIIQTTNSAKSRDFYKILGVKKSATKKEIKTAYRALAKQLHPDKNKDDPTAEGKFQDLSAAYEVLCDKEKRAKYNRGGEDALKDENQGGGGGGFWPFGQQQRQQGTPQGDKVKVLMDVSLEEVYNGEFVEFVRYKAVPKESAGKRECNCRYEMRQQRQGNRIQMYQAKVCDECNNVKLVLEERELEFEIEKGSQDGFDETVFYGEGEVEIDGDQGDLQIIYKILKHDRFERRGDDLYTNVTINLNDALTGFKTNVVALDGRKIGIKRDEITWPGMKMRVKGEGMPDYRDQSRKGNLIITFDVQFPRGKLDENSEENILGALKVLKYSGGKEGSQPILYNGLQGF